MKAWTFYWVSQLGMLAGTAVYVNAGTQLGSSTRCQGHPVSPGLLGSFVLLGLFPLIAPRPVEAVQASARCMRSGPACAPAASTAT
jgi:uncharacterized membrane protein YdjX (TVP38/TMEM64 family)